MQPIKNLFLNLIMIASSSIYSQQVAAVLVCYGKLAPETIKGYKYVILEDKHNSKTDITTIKYNNKKVYAYISLGEVNKYADHYEALKNSSLGKNEIWNSYYLNLKADETVTILLNIISNLFAKGYDGLFLDNIDNFSTFGTQKDQKDDLIVLLQKIKTAHPTKEFMQNAGIDIIAETRNFVHSVAIESIASDYLFENKSYNLRKRNDYNKSIERLKSIYKNFNIPIILIEYADTRKLYNQILARIEETDFDFFIGNIDLQKLPKLKE
jgi:polysaccharide biosynthesis protein PelA